MHVGYFSVFLTPVEKAPLTGIMDGYQTINPDEVVATIRKLRDRIGERFPDSGLKNVCQHLLGVSENMRQRTAWISQPIRWLRGITWAIGIVIVLGTLAAMIGLAISESAASVDTAAGTASESVGFVNFVTVMEAVINDIVLIGAAIFFLLTIETRYKRSRALKALHELRSIAHIIDMHQLTKDPHRITQANHVYQPGVNSPEMKMTAFELRRYLDYCAEMLSLTGKIAAVYAQAFEDSVAMASAGELESLTTGLSEKIWQKIMILESHPENPVTGSA